MLIGFLIKNHEDWELWRRAVREVGGKPIVNIADVDPSQLNSRERPSAIEDVDTFDDESDDDLHAVITR